MNCIEIFLKHAEQEPQKPAFWLPDQGVTTFGELKSLAGKAQKILLSHGLVQGDGVLLFDALSPRLYAAIIAILGLGCHVILVEPWMPLKNVNHAISLVKPKLYLTYFLGRLWGLRASSVRSIPKWSGIANIMNQPDAQLQVVMVPKETPGIITFTSGTTGNPKGVLRNQGFLINQHTAISKALDADHYKGSDLCIFANFALSNLATGRCSLIMPYKWDRKTFLKIEALPRDLQPETTTCGPAFLKKLIESGTCAGLRSIHVGGALTDCALFEEGFRCWPEATWKHVYGSSEAEPVAASDAREAVAESRRKGYFQTLYLGKPIPEIKANIENNTLWVAGPHVSPFYLGDEEANRINKKREKDGTVWHDMGDRIIQNDKGWWYSGRSKQAYAEFVLEQEIYSYLNSSASFVHRDEGRLILFGENVKTWRSELLQRFNQLSDVIESTIFRDKRHRARIDRQKSLRQ